MVGQVGMLNTIEELPKIFNYNHDDTIYCDGM
jgi:hypothetical protein